MSSSDDIYTPGASEDSDTTDSDASLSDIEDIEDEISESVVDAGWRFMANIFSDTRPDPVPVFDDAAAGINDSLGDPPFAYPADAFSYFFDDEVIGSICEWTNERASEFF